MKSVIAGVATTILLISLGACAMESSTDAEQTDIAIIAQDYFHALHAGDFGRVRTLTSEDMRFSDPTAEGQEMVITDAGRDEFLQYMEANSAGLNATADITKLFKTGNFVTLYVMYKGRIPGDAMGAPGQTLSFENEGITILTVEDGKVTHHLDYIDYETLFRHFEQQLSADK